METNNENFDRLVYAYLHKGLAIPQDLSSILNKIGVADRVTSLNSSTIQTNDISRNTSNLTSGVTISDFAKIGVSQAESSLANSREKSKLSFTAPITSNGHDYPLSNTPISIDEGITEEEDAEALLHLFNENTLKNLSLARDCVRKKREEYARNCSIRRKKLASLNREVGASRSALCRAKHSCMEKKASAEELKLIETCTRNVIASENKCTVGKKELANADKQEWSQMETDIRRIWNNFGAQFMIDSEQYETDRANIMVKSQLNTDQECEFTFD